MLECLPILPILLIGIFFGTNHFFHALQKDLQVLASLIKEGKIKPHIEKSYSFENIPAAISYIEAMRTRGKVVMIWKD